LNDPSKHQAPWYVDAIFYSVDLARFRDSDRNGYGDFRGLTEKLEYLQWLGIDAIWLLPFYRSPRDDNGYDVTDHYEIDPRLGNTGDFVAFLREAEHRDIDVVIDLVINHTSIDHRWFDESRDPDSPRRSWYVWTDDLETAPEYPVVFPPIQKSTWTWDDRGRGYYLHHFHDFEPDLNTQNPDFQTEIQNMIEYWIRLGVRGFRVDGAAFFGQKRDRDPVASHALLENIHRWAHGIHEETALLPELNLAREQLEAYVNDGQAQALFNFLGSQYLFLALATGDAGYARQVIEMTPQGHDSLQWLTFLRNQDELTLEHLTEDQRQTVLDALSPDPDTHIYDRGSRRRLAALLDGDRRRMELAFSLIFALPGTPMFVAGDEIGMGDNLALDGRDAARLPMQWSANEPNGGFSEAGVDSLITPVLKDGPFGIRHVNVEDQREDDASFLNWVRAVIRLRKHANNWMLKTRPEIDLPSTSVLQLIYRRADVDGAVRIVHNLSPEDATVDPGISGEHEPALSSEGVTWNDESVTLGSFGYAWFVPDAPEERKGDTNA